jgi:hypothetical protein
MDLTWTTIGTSPYSAILIPWITAPTYLMKLKKLNKYSMITDGQIRIDPRDGEVVRIHQGVTGWRVETVIPSGPLGVVGRYYSGGADHHEGLVLSHWPLIDETWEVSQILKEYK